MRDTTIMKSTVYTVPTLAQLIQQVAYDAGYEGRLDRDMPIGNSYSEAGFPDADDNWEVWAKAWDAGLIDQQADEASARADYEWECRFAG
jgi:hypothetical protein